MASALICCLAPHGAAQQVRGSVRDALSAEPVAGAVVILTGANGPLARTITNAQGRYLISLTSPATHIRVRRIGYLPFDLELSGSNRSSAVDVRVTRVPSLVSGVEVVAQAQCPSSNRDREALALWEHARSALLASVVAREALPALATNLTFERVMRPQDSLVVRQTSNTQTGRATRSFRAPAAAPVLMRDGFVIRNELGEQYAAPDADVLIDDSFAATHCFTIVEQGEDRRTALGLAFAPAPGREGLVDVRGILWMDPVARTLLSLEFRYTGLSAAALQARAGGQIEFLTVSNGVIAIRQWSVTLPAIEQQRPGAGRRSMRVTGRDVVGQSRDGLNERVMQLHQTGGILLRAIWPDSSSWEAPTIRVEGVVTGRTGGRALEGVVVTLDGTKDSVLTSSSGQFVLPSVLSGRYLLRVTDTAFARFVRPRVHEQSLSVSSGPASPVSISMTDRDSVFADECGTGQAAGETSTIVGHVAVDRGSREGLHLAARWAVSFIVVQGGSKSGAAMDEAGEDIPLHSSGRFTLCGVVRERPVRLQLIRESRRIADTVFSVPRDQAVVVVDWTAERPATFGGVVRRAANDAPLAGVEVWIPGLDARTTTDSAGVFRLMDLPRGAHLVQLRRLGYLVLRDTITIATGREPRRDYLLLAQSAQLDTVRTIADRARNVSPALRSFEDRRARGIGRFIGESDLRANEARPLSSALLGHLPGVTSVRAPGGGSYLASTRKECAGGSFTASCTPCFVTVYLDGTMIYTAALDRGPPPPDLSRIRSADLAGVEFYADGSSMPAQYSGTGSGCGTLLLWTREH